MITAHDSYSAHREAAGIRQRQQSRAGRDIGKIPGIDEGHPLPPEAKNRRDLAANSFRHHCELYAADTFSLEWSDDHITVIDKMESAATESGLFAVAMPRGSGKTSLAEQLVVWSLINGHRRFVMFIGSTSEHAQQLLTNIRTYLETSDLLLSDYPEVCQPLAALEGIRQRRLLHNGELIRMDFTQDRMSLPWIKGSQAAGGTVRCTGLTGSFRGARVVLPDGSSLRPDLVIADDPQTHESANSPSQVRKRERILAGDVMGLAGPGKRISGVMPCTVITEGDLADRFLDPQIHPEWNGHRSKLLAKWPDRMDLWEIYQEKRLDGLREEQNTEAADEFYRENREAMDAGAVAAWPARYLPNEQSAIQHAINLWISDPVAFAAEYQNEPIRAGVADEIPLLTAKEITHKTNGLHRGRVMDGATAVTAYVDVQDACLWWAVSAWRPDFTGHLVDWGSFPEQGRPYFTMQDLRKTIKRAKQGVGLEAALQWALDQLAEKLFATRWEREDGEPMGLDLMLVDTNYQTGTVRDWIRRQKRGKLITPNHGRYYGAAAIPLGEKKRKKGEIVGEEWRTSRIRKQLHIIHDSNYWKSFVQERLAVPIGDPGAYTFPSVPQRELQMVADHLTAEYRVRVTAERGSRRVVDEWKLPPSKPDNHLLDCISGTAVAASVCRCKLEQRPTGQKRRATAKTDTPDSGTTEQQAGTDTAAAEPPRKSKKRRRWRLG